MFTNLSRQATRCTARRFSKAAGFAAPRHYAQTQTQTRLLSTTPCLQKDPWPLPHSPEHIASTTTPTDIPPIPPLPRPNETLETMRARLVYQSRKRGTLESDLLLSTFARDELANMDEAELRQYDKLLDEADWDIYYWVTEERPIPERWANSPLLQRLRKHAKNEGKVVRKMPSLDEAPSS